MKLRMEIRSEDAVFHNCKRAVKKQIKSHLFEGWFDMMLCTSPYLLYSTSDMKMLNKIAPKNNRPWSCYILDSNLNHQETWCNNHLQSHHPTATTVYQVPFARYHHGQRCLAGYSPWGHKESGMTEQLLLFHFFRYHLSNHVIITATLLDSVLISILWMGKLSFRGIK